MPCSSGDVLQKVDTKAGSREKGTRSPWGDHVKRMQESSFLRQPTDEEECEVEL